MIADLSKANKGILEAEIELYREGGVEVELPEKTTNKILVAKIEELIASEGTPVKVDAEFLEGNKELVALVTAQGETLDVGEVIFFSEDDFKAAEEQKKLAGDGDPAMMTPSNLESADKIEIGEAIHAAKTTAPANRPVASVAPELVYLNKTVIRVSNAIAAGRSYKDVAVATGETFRLTAEEFDRDVKSRS